MKLFSFKESDKTKRKEVWFYYEARGSDYDWNRIATIEKQVSVNYVKTYVLPFPVDLTEKEYCSLSTFKKNAKKVYEKYKNNVDYKSFLEEVKAYHNS